jgi:hypothetical protein
MTLVDKRMDLVSTIKAFLLGWAFVVFASGCGDLKDSKDLDPKRFHTDLKKVIRIMESNIDIGDRAYDDY